MNDSYPNRIDEVSAHYKPATTLELISSYLFWIIASFSLLMPYSSVLGNQKVRNILLVVFIVFVFIHFALSQISRIFLIPMTIDKRRKQMLSNAFDTPLSHDKTALYYNNEYSPSVERLGANTMENAFFSAKIASEMLKKRRIVIGGYVIVWLFAIYYRHNNLELITWITQLVFSGEIIARWLKLEFLCSRCMSTYNTLHTHFLHKIGENSHRAVACILDAFVAYEAAKSSAGILLSTKIFHKLNPSLTKKWAQINNELNMVLHQGDEGEKKKQQREV